MRALRAQYFFCFAVLGSVLPYLSVLLDDGKGLGEGQIGYVASLTGWAIVLGPVAMTLLADLRVESKTLLALAFVGSGAGLLGLYWAQGFWTILIAFGVHALLAMPIIQLQDGLNFALQQQRRDTGGHIVPYHRVRVFGTFGFIVPALLLFAWMALGGAIEVSLIVAAMFCGLGFANTFLLPAMRVAGPGSAGPPADVPAIESSDSNTDVNQTNNTANATSRKTTARGASRLPTLDAARAMLEPNVLIFAIATWLCHLAAACYYGFYPLYLTRTVGIDERWVGLIADIGVCVEIGFMLAFGMLLRHFGLRTLMAVGALGMAVRTALLYAMPTVWIAVGTQLLHGLTVLTIHVGPPVFLNQRAGPSYRSSMQGLYAMLVYGTGRILGSMLAGHVAERSLLWVFAVAAALSLLAAALYALAFNDRHDRMHETV